MSALERLAELRDVAAGVAPRLIRLGILIGYQAAIRDLERLHVATGVHPADRPCAQARCLAERKDLQARAA